MRDFKIIMNILKDIENLAINFKVHNLERVKFIDTELQISALKVTNKIFSFYTVK